MAQAPDARERSTRSLVYAAERLERFGRFTDAADSLVSYLRLSPGDAGVRWRLAQLLLWTGRAAEAAAHYDTAVSDEPDDPWLRVEYAELLMRSGRLGDARTAVRPAAEALAATAPARARALTLLGTLEYWRWDLPAAIRAFEAALELDPEDAAAAATLSEIRGLLRPWTRFAAGLFDDDQPYRRGRGEIGFGAYLNPLWTFEVNAVPHLLDRRAGVSGASGPGNARAAGELRARVRGYLPGPALEFTTSLGAVRQDRSEWVGSVGVALRLPQGIRVSVSGDRERYLWTAASVDTVLVVERAVLALDRADAARWAGHVSLRSEGFPDGNRAWGLSGWVLAPVHPRLRLGAAASWADARRTQWAVEEDRYEPYYTPENQRTVQLLAELSGALRRARGRVGVSWGAWAREEAPVSVFPAPGDTASVPGVAFVERSYHPWSLSGSLDHPAGERATLRLEIERSETAFYRLVRGGIAVVITLGRPPGP